MKQHKWHKEIKAWADGAEIQHQFRGEWKDCKDPVWGELTEYRIKPQPFEPHIMEMAARALAIPEISDAVDRLLEAFEKPKEPQYLGVAVLTDGRIILVRDGQLIPLSKGQSVHKIIGKIPLIMESNDELC